MDTARALQPSLFEDEDLQAPYGIDQASLALVPFADRMVDRTKPVRIQYQTMVDGKIKRMNLVMVPGAERELPSQHDQMVLLTLLQMSHDQGEYNTLRARRSEVFQRLGWQLGGSQYKSFEQCLKRLNGVALEFETELLSRRGTPYQKRMDLSHLIDRAVVDEDENVYIEWGGLIRQAFELGDFKRLDWNLALSLPSPLTVALYRYLDRVVLSGETVYDVGWKTLATAVGMSVDGYHRPARFRAIIQPHIDSLIAVGVVQSWEYQRGGKFHFELANYLRSQIRRILGEKSVFPEQARQLVAGFDELAIIRQIDSLWYRSPSTGGLLVDAIRKGYELRYPDDEPEAFAAMFGLLLGEEQRAYLRFAERLTTCVHHGDPATWPLDLRICIRFMVTHNLDPERCQ